MSPEEDNLVERSPDEDVPPFIILSTSKEKGSFDVKEVEGHKPLFSDDGNDETSSKPALVRTSKPAQKKVGTAEQKKEKIAGRSRGAARAVFSSPASPKNMMSMIVRQKRIKR